MREIQLSESVKESLKQVSVRGRMALATIVLESVLSHFKIKDEEKEPLINIFWQFVEERNLGKWGDDRGEVKILMAIEDFTYSEKTLPLGSEFGNMPKFVLEMINAIDWIGLDDLYGTVLGYSPTTHACTVKVLELALCNGFEIPSLDPFLKSPITEQDGFGTPVPRTFFRLC